MSSAIASTGRYISHIQPATHQLHRVAKSHIAIPRLHQTPSKRLFSTNFNPTAFTSPTTNQTLTAHRTLPYTATQIFTVISDIPSYPLFIPYLTSARVSQYSTPDANNTRWPHLATLKIGYANGPVDINETFTSRVFCVAPQDTATNAAESTGYIEALSGSAVTSALDEARIAHHLAASSEHGRSSGADAEASHSPLDYLRTLWTIRPVRGGEEAKGASTPQTDVELSIDYRFRSMMFEMLGATVAPRLADGIVGVFEARMKKVLG